MHWKVRNRLFIYALILLGLIGLDHLSGRSLADAVNGYIRKKFIEPGQIWPGLELAVLDLIARFVLLCVVIHYYQRSIYIDRMYYYIYRLEGQLCELLGPDVITREGKVWVSRNGVPDDNEKDNRPRILRWIGPLNTCIFPIVLSLLAIFSFALTIRSIRQGIAQDGLVFGDLFTDVLSMLCSLGIVFYSVLYMVWVQLRR